MTFKNHTLALEASPILDIMDKDREYNISLFSHLRWPVVAYGILFGLYAALLPGKWIWFSYHPLCMMVSFVSLAGYAALIKKVKGAENTRIHGYVMSAATLLAAFGYYVIYSNKEINHKTHLTTLHGKLGVLVLVNFLCFSIVGGVLLHPDWGLLKTNKTIRTFHKWGGRAFTATAWACSVLGFITMQKSLALQIVFGLPLLIGGFYVLL
mmetsp:Transcript_8105/g.8258  ORF Transcript_8105/g.8258 Transcript_8105/m.8258 type:complete len:210 (+) Transcript_8105:18-647(+)